MIRDGRYTVCRGCARRAVGCHAECEDYKAFAKSRAELYEKKRTIAEAHYKFNFSEKKKLPSVWTHRRFGR